MSQIGKRGEFFNGCDGCELGRHPTTALHQVEKGRFVQTMNHCWLSFPCQVSQFRTHCRHIVSLVDVPVRNVRPRLRSVSPTILDSLEDDQEAVQFPLSHFCSPALLDENLFSRNLCVICSLAQTNACQHHFGEVDVQT